MSYIPPHKRHLKDPVKPTPVPDYLLTNFKKKIDFKSNIATGKVITFSEDCIFKWFLVGSNGIYDEEVPPSVKLVPLSTDCTNVRKPLVLMNNDFQKVSEGEERTWFLLLAEKVEEDLVFAYRQAKRRMEDHHHLLDYSDKLRLVASFGKLIFYGNHGEADSVAECSYKNSYKRFSTDVPTSFIQNMKSKAIPSHEFSIDEEKEIYIVKLSHYTRCNATIHCKCTVNKDGRLSMYKAQLNPIRHLFVDVSCIDKNLDMRLMLAGKRRLMGLTEKEMSNIQRLLDSATVDPNMKGRLRWPLVSKNGYRILEFCHVRKTIYKTPTLKLKVRETDGFSESYRVGEIESGVTLILRDINTSLQGNNIERGRVLEMLRDALGTIWDFLCCDANLV